MLNKRRAVRNALARLGLQAGAPQVVAALAEQDVHVSQELVQRVRREVLAELLPPRQGRAGPPAPLDRRRTRPFQKKPRRHGRG